MRSRPTGILEIIAVDGPGEPSSALRMEGNVRFSGRWAVKAPVAVLTFRVEEETTPDQQGLPPLVTKAATIQLEKR
jgi:hypothetical protein